MIFVDSDERTLFTYSVNGNVFEYSMTGERGKKATHIVCRSSVHHNVTHISISSCHGSLPNAQKQQVRLNKRDDSTSWIVCELAVNEGRTTAAKLVLDVKDSLSTRLYGDSIRTNVESLDAAIAKLQEAKALLLK